MEYAEIRELALLMKEMGLTSLEYRGGGSSVKMERAAGAMPVNVDDSPVMPVAEKLEESRDVKEAPGGVIVKSPMVGVFYCAPGFDKEPYVTVGTAVKTGDVLCIVEAMKIMNEITAECDGIVTEIFAENKQVVEYGQPLFRIDTSWG